LSSRSGEVGMADACLPNIGLLLGDPESLQIEI
jgi:hypothetical protein